MTKLELLSARQRKALRFIGQYFRHHQRPPSFREIDEAIQTNSTSMVGTILSQLSSQGLVTREKRIARSLRLTEQAQHLLEEAFQMVADTPAMVQVPLVGHIVAGRPVELYFNSDFHADSDEDYVEVSAAMLPVRSGQLRALEVRGLSMIDAMVNDGDVVIMQPVSEARNGEMVAAWLPESNEMTLKHFYRQGEKVTLRPANPDMKPIELHASQVVVQAKVMMVIRQTA